MLECQITVGHTLYMYTHRQQICFNQLLKSDSSPFFLGSNKTNLRYMVLVSFKVCAIELEMLDVIGSS